MKISASMCSWPLSNNTSGAERKDGACLFPLSDHVSWRMSQSHTRRKRKKKNQPVLTFEVQVAGSVGVLRHGARVDLQRVYIVGIPGHHHVVPLIVVERLVWVALHQRRAVAEIKDVVNVPVRKESKVLHSCCYFWLGTSPTTAKKNLKYA